MESPHPVDATLHLIANPPIPGGLEERVHTRLRSAPRTGRLLDWPMRVDTGWMKSAAAAAIVVIVAGGGWGVYSRVDHPQPAKVMLPATGTAGGGFSSAGAMRTPQTLNGPVLKHPVKNHSRKTIRRAVPSRAAAPIAVPAK
jgi:hypothetical protein